MDRPFNLKVGGRVHFFPFKAEFYSTKKLYFYNANFTDIIRWKLQGQFIEYLHLSVQSIFFYIWWQKITKKYLPSP